MKAITLARQEVVSMRPPLTVTLARSRELCETLPSLCAESTALIARSRELCLPYRRMRGGSDLEGEGTRDGHRSVAPPPPRPALVTQAEALWKFLESRRGGMFCTPCISNALMATKRIDRAILSAEGRGARRRYGACESCGKERLLCGLTR